MPARFKYTSMSATTDHTSQSLEEFYRIKVYYPFLDKLGQEIRRSYREKDGGESKDNTEKVLKSLHSVIMPMSLKAGVDLTASTQFQDLHMLCKFYSFKEEEDKHLTELRVFCSSYSLPKHDPRSTLKCIKENDVHLVFPIMYELLKALPVTNMKHSFSKLKMVKHRLQSLCGEERLYDLMLPSIEIDITVDKEEVINIFKHMANRRMLL